MVCDNWYADLHPGITVAVRFFSARSAATARPFAVIRERTRSDHRCPTWASNWAGSCTGNTPPC